MNDDVKNVLERYFTDIEMSGRTGLDKGNNIKLIIFIKLCFNTL